MKILFVYSLYDIISAETPLSSPEQMQFGISYISAVLKNAGHHTTLVVLSRTSGKKWKNILHDAFTSVKPDVVCYSAVSTEYSFIVSCARYIRAQFPKVFHCIGGAHVSMNASDDMLNTFDALCISEGEYPVLSLVEQLSKGSEPDGIPNLWIKQKKGIQKNLTRDFLQNLDDLPFPDRTLWERWIMPDLKARHSILLGRGCPFECTYCCNHKLKHLSTGAYTRYRNPENILQEIKQVIEKYPECPELYLEVETISVNKEWVIALCGLLKEFNEQRIKPISFGTNLRIVPHMKLDSLFAAFRQANFRFINIGLESGSLRVRTEVLNRSYLNDDVLHAVQKAREYGLQVSLLNLVGVPGETEQEFKETVALNRACKPDWIGASIFFPYPGTKLYELCKRENYLPQTIDTNCERWKTVLRMPQFSKRAIENQFIWFEFNVFKGRKPISMLLKRILYLIIRRNALYAEVYRKLYQIRNILRGQG